MRREMAVALGLVIVAGAVQAGAENQYVGVKKCRSCHSKELMGDQVAEWKKGPHAGAFKTLQGDEAREIAREKGMTVLPHEAPECLRCHVTAHDAEASAIKYEIDPTDGVQCESCHGPGSAYRSKRVMSDHDRAVAKGMWEPGKDEKICTSCHNADSPTMKSFDYAGAKEKIAHPIPADVKGRYLEVEKERKAAGRSGGGS